MNERAPELITYYIGDKQVTDTEGMAILAEDGTEYYVSPAEFESLGMPGADMYRWSPRVFDKNAEQGEL